MGRHTKLDRPDDEPVPDAGASAGPYYGAPPFDAYSGPADDQVYEAPYDDRFESLPGDYPGDYPVTPGGFFADDPGPPPVMPSDRPARPGRFKVLSVLPVPMLPIVALVIAVGIVAYALSTQQISLNFAGGAPARDTQTEPRDNQVREPGERAGGAAVRPDGLIIAFKVTSRRAAGFGFTAAIANKGSQPVATWALAFRIDSASVTAVRGATVVRTGKVAFVRGRTAIEPGATVRIAFAAKGTPARPSSCVLNSLPCAFLE